MLRPFRTALFSQLRRVNQVSSRRAFLSSCQRPGMPADFTRDEAKSSHTMNTSNGADMIEKNDKEDVYADLSDACKNVHRRVYDFLARDATSDARLGQVQRMTRESLGVIGEALDRYSLDHLSFSYNGGKDCLVLLILYLAALHTHSSKATSPSLPSTLQTVYIVTPNPFPAVTSFVYHSAKKYHLSIQQYHKPMREAFESYLQDFSQVKAIFVGTRRTDPHGAKLTAFDPTDGGWPKFVRVHPVIDWHYADIWGFVRGVGVEYCELYDMGYTSLGGTDDTHPNPVLAVKDQGGDEGGVTYRPAYELVQDEEERLGRDGRQ